MMTVLKKEKVLKFVSEMIRQNQLDAYIKDEKEIISYLFSNTA